MNVHFSNPFEVLDTSQIYDLRLFIDGKAIKKAPLRAPLITLVQAPDFGMLQSSLSRHRLTYQTLPVLHRLD